MDLNASVWSQSRGSILRSILNITRPLADLQNLPEVGLFEFVIEGVSITAIGSLGILSNFASLLVMSRPQMRSSTNCGLQGLAAFDTVVLACSVLMLGLKKLGSRIDFLNYYSVVLSPHVVPIAYPIGLIAQTGSVWTTVGVTIERFIAVCHPLKAKSLCTCRRARILTSLVAAMSILYNLPRFWEVRTDEVYSPELGRNVYTILASPLRMNKLYYEVYHVWMYLLVMYFVPFLLLTVLNVRIWRTVRNANRERLALNRKRAGELNLATVLTCVVFVFLLCNILALIVNVVEYFDVFVRWLVQVSNMLVTLNSSVNFIIYCIFGHKFKRTFLMLFCSYRMGRRTRDSLQESTWIRFRTIKSSSGSQRSSLNVNARYHVISL